MLLIVSFPFKTTRSDQIIYLFPFFSENQQTVPVQTILKSIRKRSKMVVKEQKWTPTVRRGPIAAEMKSPAPNSVDLPPLLGKLTVNSYMIERMIIIIVQVYGHNTISSSTY